MPHRPRITVITPNLNAGRYIEPCICSVLDQAYPDVEHFVVDGGSDDNSVELIRLYENDLAGWRSGPDQGPAAAINWALQKATGEFVVILPSDSVMHPGTLDAIAKMHAKAPNAQWLVGHAVHIDAFDDPIAHVGPLTVASLMTWLMHNDAPVDAGTTAYHRSLFEQVGPLDDTLQYAWDYELHARLLAHGVPPVALNHEMTSVRQLGERRTINETVNRGAEEIAVAEKHIDRLSANQRPVLWRNLDERRQIFAIAEAEASGAESQKLLWRRLMDRPWWIHSKRYRRAMGTNGMGMPEQTNDKAVRDGDTGEGEQRRAAGDCCLGTGQGGRPDPGGCPAEAGRETDPGSTSLDVKWWKYPAGRGGEGPETPCSARGFSSLEQEHAVALFPFERFNLRRVTCRVPHLTRSVMCVDVCTHQPAAEVWHPLHSLLCSGPRFHPGSGVCDAQDNPGWNPGLTDEAHAQK